MATPRAPIRYALHGSGPQRVLVMHDWNGDHTNYDPILPYLNCTEFSYAFVDLRGYGASRDVPGRYTVGEIASDCMAVADELGWRRFHIVGHSMTGMAAQRIAADAPSRVKSAIAVCPSELAVIPNCGHYPMQECPPYFATLIERFLRRMGAT